MNIIKLIKTIISGDKFNYKKHWDSHYSSGGNSGNGSYGILAEFKAEAINNFIKEKEIVSVIEFGCGDGNQLRHMNYKKYLGLDIAKASIEQCHSIFSSDKTKSFMVYDPGHFINNGFIKSELVVCLDVLYHIIPEEEFLKTLQDIFSSSSKYVILYTSIDTYKSEPYRAGTHVFHRDALSYLSKFEEFEIEKIIEQKYKDLSSAHFILMVKR